MHIAGAPSGGRVRSEQAHLYLSSNEFVLGGLQNSFACAIKMRARTSPLAS